MNCMSCIGVLISIFHISSNPIFSFPNFKSCLIAQGVNPKVIVKRDISYKPYEELNYQWNRYGGIKYPLAFIVVQSTADVQATMHCGQRSNIKIVPKSGGHSFEKYSFGDNNSVVLDLQMLNGINVNSHVKRADVGSGVLLGPLSWSLYSAGEFGIASGLCPSVGISLALGGGVGNLPRYYGITTDAIHEVDIVTADGKLITVNEETYPNLLWALKGAGVGASFGIVTRFQLKLQQAPKFILVSVKTYTQMQFIQVFDAWQRLLKENPTNVINSIIRLASDGFKLDFNIVVEQDDLLTERLTLLKAIWAKFPKAQAPTVQNVLSYPSYLLETVFPDKKFYNLTKPSDLATKINRLSSPQDYFKTRSFFVSKLVENTEELQAFSHLLSEIPLQASLIFEAYGGAINSVPPNATAFVHRNNLYHVTVGYTGDDYVTNGRNWMTQFFESTRLVLNHTESYQNYADKELENHLERYYGENLARLVKIKREVDPTNYFSSPETIPLTLQR